MSMPGEYADSPDPQRNQDIPDNHDQGDDQNTYYYGRGSNSPINQDQVDYALAQFNAWTQSDISDEELWMHFQDAFRGLRWQNIQTMGKQTVASIRRFLRARGVWVPIRHRDRQPVAQLLAFVAHEPVQHKWTQSDVDYISSNSDTYKKESGMNMTNSIL